MVRFSGLLTILLARSLQNGVDVIKLWSPENFWKKLDDFKSSINDRHCSCWGVSVQKI